MENDNKQFQETENEEVLTPIEKVQADISSKIADAAAEIQDEIDAVGADEEMDMDGGLDVEADAEGMDESWSDEAWDNSPIEEAKPEPVKVTVNRNTFIVSLIGAALVGALALFLCMQIPQWYAARPEGTTVVKVNGESITDLDVNYYIYAQAMNYATKNNIAQDELKDYDWDQEVDGEKLSVTIKNKAVEDAINEVLTIQKGAELGVTLDDAKKAQISSQLSGITASYGEDGFALRARSMGISSIKQYSKMYEKVMALQTVQDDISADKAKYYPSDESVLNDYIQPDRATVKHILIKNSGEEAAPAEGEEAAPAEDKMAKAQSVLERAKSGEDFDALVKEFNEDTGAGDEGYTFGPGEMMPEFEQAAFALKIGEISDLVETSYGYHIIKRIPGLYELQGYWRAEAGDKIKRNNNKIAKLSVSAVVADVVAANEELMAKSSEAAK